MQDTRARLAAAAATQPRTAAGRFGHRHHAEAGIELDRSPRRLRRTLALAAAVGVSLTVSACDQVDVQLEDYVGSASASHTEHAPAEVTGAAMEALDGLRVRKDDADESTVPYDRSGLYQESESKPWRTVDGSCDTRDYILARDLTEVHYVSGSDCDVAGGTLYDAYTKNEVYQPFGPRGPVKPEARPYTNIDIEHVVSLGDAHRSGAGAWSGQAGQQRRIDIANDPMNLLAAGAQANTSKSDKSFDQWPAQAPEGMFNAEYTCDLAARQVYVKAKYDLSVTESEKDALAGALSDCPGQTLPEKEGLWWNQPQPPLSEFGSIEHPREQGSADVPAGAEDEAAHSAPVQTDPKDAVEFQNCTDVWEATGGPIRSSDPGFLPKFDRDGNGVGCESDPR